MLVPVEELLEMPWQEVYANLHLFPKPQRDWLATYHEYVSADHGNDRQLDRLEEQLDTMAKAMTEEDRKLLSKINKPPLPADPDTEKGDDTEERH